VYPDLVTDEGHIAMSHCPEYFLQETDGSKIALLDGSAAEHLCELGVVRTNILFHQISVHPHKERTKAPTSASFLEEKKHFSAILLVGAKKQ
jgi:hypothetical protein